MKVVKNYWLKKTYDDIFYISKSKKSKKPEVFGELAELICKNYKTPQKIKLTLG